MTTQDAIQALWTASLATPTDLKSNAVRDIAAALIVCWRISSRRVPERRQFGSHSLSNS
jgi:hypothetical protein